MISDKDLQAAIELAMEDGKHTVVTIIKYVRDIEYMGLREAVDKVCYMLNKMGHKEIVQNFLNSR